MITVPLLITAVALTVTPSVSDHDQSHRPAGLIALGHSGLTGANSDPNLPGADAWQNSWATGSAPSVNSIARRMIEIRPETDGNIENAAVAGSPASALTGQAVRALGNVPRPALVIIMTIDNDIRCDGTDGRHVARFGEHVSNAIDTIATASPDSQILLLGQLGRPATFAAALAQNPDAARAHAGNSMCDLFDRNGDIDRAHVAEVTRLVDLYETELDNVCAQVPQCHRDDRALAEFVDDIDELVPGDWNHLTATGQARIAETIWPVVAAILSHTEPTQQARTVPFPGAGG